MAMNTNTHLKGKTSTQKYKFPPVEHLREEVQAAAETGSVWLILRGLNASLIKICLGGARSYVKNFFKVDRNRQICPRSILGRNAIATRTMHTEMSKKAIHQDSRT